MLATKITKYFCKSCCLKPPGIPLPPVPPLPIGPTAKRLMLGQDGTTLESDLVPGPLPFVKHFDYHHLVFYSDTEAPRTNDLLTVSRQGFQDPKTQVFPEPISRLRGMGWGANRRPLEGLHTHPVYFSCLCRCLGTCYSPK